MTTNFSYFLSTFIHAFYTLQNTSEKKYEFQEVIVFLCNENSAEENYGLNILYDPDINL